MLFLDKGAYARVYINNDRTLVKKELPLYYRPSDERYIDAMAITDLIMHQTFKNLEVHGVATINSYKLQPDREKIKIHMPYYGKSLHEIGSSLTKQDLYKVLIQLCDSIQNLLDHGIMHTDIKPANILCDENNIVTLIDYNLMSIRDSCGKWPINLGTWCYSAPELVNRKSPEDSSVIWSIAMVWAECIVGKTPLHRDYFKTDNSPGVMRRKRWALLFKSLRIECPNHYPLPIRYADLFTAQELDLFNSCVQWNPDDRCSLSNLRECFVVLAGNELNIENPIKTKIKTRQALSYNQFPTIRKAVFRKLNDFCAVTGRDNIRVNAAILFDLADGVYDAWSTQEYIGGAVLICLWLEGLYVFDDLELSENLVEYFGSRRELECAALSIGESLDWFVIVNSSKITWDWLLKRTEPYEI